MSNYQSSETFAWSLLVSNTESESEMFSEFDRVVARKNTQVFLHDKPKTSCSRRIFMNEQQPTSPEKSAAVTDVTQRIGTDIRASSYFSTRRATDVVCEACFTAMS